MKFSFVRAAAALTLAASAAMVAGCGGKAQFTVQGVITDQSGVVVSLANSGLVLANGSDTVSVPAGSTSFAFPKKIDYGTDYNITIKTQPAHMTCGVNAGSGSAGHTVSIQAAVVCVQNQYTLGGQFTGITVAADGTTARTVTLLNGSNSQVTLSSASATNGAGDFAFPATVADGTAYGVTVVDPNNGLNCTVTNGTGVMHETPVTNILVTCVPK
ncbi:hypothetical protein FHW83_004031 [Duganella sp. SG902]|uniref:hypothetical protein n=1 Tax=Duganella sp. SG902 TaxID=2587016 RepID=UPI00159D053E|nr:hypothetical protein [Duganella sp. SG902]NVM78207.1 hypothetical protein [Duganella sp. SG902]